MHTWYGKALLRGVAVRGRFAGALALVAGLAIIVMTLLLFAGVIARTVLGSPIPGITEISANALMVAVVYLALAGASHIRISIIARRFPPGVRRVLGGVLGLLSTLVLATFFVATAGAAWDAQQIGERVVGSVSFEIWPWRVLVSAGLLVATIGALVDSLATFSGIETSDEAEGTA